MLVHICDRCHEQIGGMRFDLDKFRIFMKGGIAYGLSDKEFCSLHCMQQYLINGLKGRGLDKDIKV